MEDKYLALRKKVDELKLELSKCDVYDKYRLYLEEDLREAEEECSIAYDDWINSI